MLYKTKDQWLNADRKRVLLFAMSGLGKTYVSNMLRSTGNWFHYSVDYRIGTRYMGEHILDNAKAEAMKVPFLAELLRSDSIYIASNITFENLDPLSSYLGKPGNADLGGLPLAEYRKRQDQHHVAERAALLDTEHFIKRAETLYGYQNFICDTGGSICEVVDPSDPQDPILKALEEQTLMVWIKGDEDHTDALVARFDKQPKPMCYQAEFLIKTWNDYLSENNAQEGDVDPNAFVRFAYAKALHHRQPRYAAMAQRGLTIDASDMARVGSEQDFVDLIGDTLAQTA